MYFDKNVCFENRILIEFVDGIYPIMPSLTWDQLDRTRIHSHKPGSKRSGLVDLNLRGNTNSIKIQFSKQTFLSRYIKSRPIYSIVTVDIKFYLQEYMWR